MLTVILFLFLVGVCFGSFLNVVILRSAKKKQFVSGRSICPKCQYKIAWYDNIPVLSYLILGGVCRNCKKRISIVYPVVEFLTGVFFVWWFLIGFGFFRLVGSPWSIVQPVFWLAVGLMFIVIFVSDLLFMVIPFGLNIFLFLWALLYKLMLVASGNMRMVDFLISLVLGFALAGAFLLINKITNKIRGVDGFGFGDVYLSPTLGLLLGWPRLAVGIFTAFIIGSLVGLVLIAMGKKSKGDYLPFGPFLVLGTTIALVYGSALWHLYWSLV